MLCTCTKFLFRLPLIGFCKLLDARPYSPFSVMPHTPTRCDSPVVYARPSPVYFPCAAPSHYKDVAIARQSSLSPSLPFDKRSPTMAPPLGLNPRSALAWLNAGSDEDSDDHYSLEDPLFSKDFPTFYSCPHCHGDVCQVETFFDELCRHVHFTQTNAYRRDFQWMNKKRKYVYHAFNKLVHGPDVKPTLKPPACVIWWIRIQLPNPPGQSWVYKNSGEKLPEEFKRRGWKKVVFGSPTHMTVYKRGPDGTYTPKSCVKPLPVTTSSDEEEDSIPPRVVFCAKENEDAVKPTAKTEDLGVAARADRADPTLACKKPRLRK